ncbi:hypothetical protein Tco_0961087 [Tanacetum coccineum]
MHILTKPQVFYDDTHKQALGYQNPFNLQKAQRIKPTLYDGSVIAKKHDVISVIDDEDTLILEEESRSKMLDKQNYPISIKQKINISPIDYSKLNKIKEDYGKRVVTKKELSAEQAFWLKHSNHTFDTSVKSHTPVRIEAPSELPKESWVNESLKKIKYHLASFDKMVKKRTTSDAITAVKNPVFHSKTKHIEIRHHFIRDSNEKKLIQMIKIHTDQNVADLLTKAFDVGRFQYLIATEYAQMMLETAADDAIQVSTVGLTYYWRHLKLEDSDGVSNLPTTEIFEQLALMGSPPHTNVADEVASTGVDIRYGGAATTVTGLEVGQGSGNIDKTSTMPHDLPLPKVHTLRSDEGRMQHNELMDLVTKLSDRVVALETDLTQTKKFYGDAFTKLIKKGRKIAQIDKDEGITLVQMGVSTASTDFTTANVPVTTAGAEISIATFEVKTAGNSVDDIAAESFVNNKISLIKDMIRRSDKVIKMNSHFIREKGTNTTQIKSSIALPKLKMSFEFSLS